MSWGTATVTARCDVPGCHISLRIELEHAGGGGFLPVEDRTLEEHGWTRNGEDLRCDDHDEDNDDDES